MTGSARPKQSVSIHNDERCAAAGRPYGFHGSTTVQQAFGLDVPVQRPDLLAHRLLGDVQLVGRAREVAALGDIAARALVDDRLSISP